MSIEVVGLEEVLARLARLSQRASSDRTYEGPLTSGINELHRFAVSISPEITGAYKAAHRVSVGNARAQLSNAIRYAGDVESRHGVYERTYEEAKDVGKEVTKEILEEILR